jgi:hypothetical protein
MTEQIKFEVFHGQLTPNLAHIYVRVASFPGGGAWKATLTDPCYWSSDLPSLYRLKVELRHAGQVIATHEQLFGMRFLGRRGRFFYLSNQRWVLRGAFGTSVAEESLPAWRELATAMIVEEPSQELCSEASRIGVVLIAIVSGNSDIRQFAQWPAVSLILCESSFDVKSNIQSAAPNVILGVSSQDAEFDVPMWSQATMINAAALPNCVEQLATRPIPLILCRRLKRPLPLPDARAACDALQRDVVHHGDFAGYVV